MKKGGNLNFYLTHVGTNVVQQKAKTNFDVISFLQ
ncbi:MAG: hypothetical protein RLZZ500_1094 [Bacteroidota bacterium]|jgi:hypothetical protein